MCIYIYLFAFERRRAFRSLALFISSWNGGDFPVHIRRRLLFLLLWAHFSFLFIWVMCMVYVWEMWFLTQKTMRQKYRDSDIKIRIPFGNAACISVYKIIQIWKCRDSEYLHTNTRTHWLSWLMENQKQISHSPIHLSLLV